MRRLRVCMMLVSSSCWGAEDSAAILNSLRTAVAAQLARAANYTCVQTAEREYLIDEKQVPRGCGEPAVLKTKLLMRDRLRLDIAVSEGREIYSWHGEAKFTSSNVSEVVQTGPVSSGNFVGFLENLFVEKGARFTYAGEGEQNGSRTYSFNYVVPRANSAYRVQGRHGAWFVPFHGSFSVTGADYRLASLRVVADAIPEDSDICSAETNVTYQIVSIAGHPSLTPATFLLRMDDNSHSHTVSRNEYSQCREFRGESTVRFQFTDDTAQLPARQASADEWIPAGISLQVRLRTPIDDHITYAGDAAEGVLLRRFKVPGTETIVPKGAVLAGVITKLENHYLPQKYQLTSVNFSRLSYSGHSYLLNAHPKTSPSDSRTLAQIYRWPLPASVENDRQAGVFVNLGSHLRVHGFFAAEWITAGPSPNKADLSSAGPATKPRLVDTGRGER